MATRTQVMTRRSFLFTAGAAAAASAAAIVAKNSPPAQAPDKSKRASRGYHATKHVNNYYRTTQV